MKRLLLKLALLCTALPAFAQAPVSTDVEVGTDVTCIVTNQTSSTIVVDSIQFKIANDPSSDANPQMCEADCTLEAGAQMRVGALSEFDNHDGLDCHVLYYFE